MVVEWPIAKIWFLLLIWLSLRRWKYVIFFFFARLKRKSNNMDRDATDANTSRDFMQQELKYMHRNAHLGEIETLLRILLWEEIASSEIASSQRRDGKRRWKIIRFSATGNSSKLINRLSDYRSMGWIEKRIRNF